MKIEVLISTMNLINYKELIERMNVEDSLIINQTSKGNIENVTDGKYLLYNYQEKGLSKSRNRAIENSKADICVIADDDIRYNKEYKSIIESGYKKYSDADIIAFYVDNIEEKRKRPKRKEGKINFIKSMKIQSVQVTFRRKSIIEKDIKFNENFGTGTELYMGEENIFIVECLKKGLKIYYIPITIATIQDNDSTWFKGYNRKFFFVKGAVFYKMSKFLYPILILQFALRKRKKYIKEIKMKDTIKYMFQGVKKYKKEYI